MADLPLLAGLERLVDDFDVLLCDVFGTIHDAAGVFPDAIKALLRFRSNGGTVVLVSNASAPSSVLAASLATMGVAATCYDAIVTSADLARDLLVQRGWRRIHHIGSAKDEIALAGLDASLAPVATADVILCTGYPAIDPENDDFAVALDRQLEMICTNPDTQIDLGGTILRFAGLVADRYRALGGRVIATGKPSAMIYAEALARATQIRAARVDTDRVIAVGDSLALDVIGALNCGFHAAWVSKVPAVVTDVSLRRDRAWRLGSLTW